jgi:plastocyanin
MRKQKKMLFFRICAVILAVVLIQAVQNGWATTHVVQFGGSLGLTYSPSNFTAVVGDTVNWTGDFTVHPLSSTTIPANAQSWHAGSGTAFTYVIQVPGAYHYQCDLHYSLGMVGTFEAIASGVRDAKPDAQIASPDMIAFRDAAGFGERSVSFLVPHTELITLEVFDLLGHRVAAIVNRVEEPGTHTVALDPQVIGRGLYLFKLTGGGAQIVKTGRVLNR